MSSPPKAGLSDDAIGAIAYFTPVMAIFFLAIRRYNKRPYVRFHAWQSLVFNVFVIFFGYVLVFAAPYAAFLGTRVLFGIMCAAGLVCVPHVALVPDRRVEWQARQAARLLGNGPTSRLTGSTARRTGVLTGQADDEAGVAGLGLNFKLSGKLLRDDAVNDFEAEAGAGALWLGGEEWLEDAGKNIGWNSGAVIGDRDDQPFRLGPGGDFEFPALGEASTALSMRLVQTWLRA